MRSSIVKIAVLTSFAFIAAALVFVLGLFFGERIAIAKLNVEMSGTQAMLAFNRISSEKRLRYLLSNDCPDVALAQVKVDEDQDMQLLAGFFQRTLPDWTIRYISQGDPNLIEEIRKTKINSTNTWTIPDCRKSSKAN